MGVNPTIIVHNSKQRASLTKDRFWNYVRRVGCPIISAPNYSAIPCGSYPPANMAGALLLSAQLFPEDCFVLMDPDMVFTRPVDFGGDLAADRVPYLKRGVELVELLFAGSLLTEEQKTSLTSYGGHSVGVPYVIPRSMAENLAIAWLHLLYRQPRMFWEMVMTDWSFAAHGLYGKFLVTDFSQNNENASDKVSGSLLHYCYGSAEWSKRMWVSGPVPGAKIGGDAGTIHGELDAQFTELSKEI